MLTISAVAAILAIRRPPPERREPILTPPPEPPRPREAIALGRDRPPAAPLRRVLAPARSPRLEAREFVAHMQAWTGGGDFPWTATRIDAEGGGDGLWDHYREWCRERGVHEAPSNLLGQELGRLAERRDSGIVQRQVTDYATGKRRRLVHYVIAPPVEASAAPVAEAAGPAPAAATPAPRRRARA